MVRAQPKRPPKRGKASKEQKGSIRGRKHKEKNKHRAKKRKEEKKAHRNRNGRRKTPAAGDGDALDCCVLLTRLEEKRLLGKVKHASKAAKLKSVKDKNKEQPSRTQRRTKSDRPLKRNSSGTNRQAAEPKPNQSEALLTPAPAVFEPRRRRMASLNAEAVNSLLLYRAEGQTSSLHKKQQHANRGLATDGGLTKAAAPEEHKGDDIKELSHDLQANVSGRPRKKKARKEPESIDWSAVFTPAPRRQAGLTAATLLKLTSAPYGSRRQKKTDAAPASNTKTTPRPRKRDNL